MRKILVVDDTLATCVPLTRLLNRRGYDATFAVGGAEALAVMQSWQPDVLLLDVMMPVVDGYEVLRRIRLRPHLAAVAVVMYTAISNDESQLRAKRLGSQGYVVKGASMDDICAALEAATTLRPAA